jgi:tetratricopeptide (TPR) repeat protein
VSRIGTRNTAAWEAMQRARPTLDEIEKLVSARNVPAALAKITEADAALAKVEAIDKNWREPVVERAWLAFRTARLYRRTDPELAKAIEVGLGHADRALKMAPNDLGAVEVRGSLHYWQWINNLAPEGQADALLSSAEADFTAVTAANARAATAWNALSHLRINKGQFSEAKLAAERAYNSDPYLVDIDRTIYRLFGASLDLGLRDEARKWCTIGNTRYPENFLFTECKLWLYALRGSEPSMPEVWKQYDSVVAASPAGREEYYKRKGKLMVALAFLRAKQPDSARALVDANQGDAEIDPRLELANLAAIVYAQLGDKDKALAALAKFLAANPQQRAFAAASNDNSWWLESLRSDPRYQSLVKSVN